MFYWTRCHYRGNTAGSKPALNNGFDLFSVNPVVKLFPSFVSRNLRKTLAYWHWSCEILTERSCYFVFCILTFSEHVLCQISIFVLRRVTRILNYYSAKFHEILTSGSIEISAFPLNCAVTIFWLTARALHLTGFSIPTNNPRKQGTKLLLIQAPMRLNFLRWQPNPEN